MPIPSIPNLQMFSPGNVTITSAKAVWLEATNALSYVIEVSFYPDFKAPANAPSATDLISGYPKEVTGTEFDITSLLIGQGYYVRLKAKNGLEESAYSQVRQVTTLPEIPQAFNPQKITSNSFRIWVSQPKGATFWLLDVIEYVNNTTPLIVSGYNQLKITEYNYQVTSLKSDTAYSYKVLAGNEFGTSIFYSQERGLRTLPGSIDVPQNVRAEEVKDNSFQVVFDEVSQATKYFLTVSVGFTSPTILPGYDGKEITAIRETVTTNSNEFYYFKVKASDGTEISSFSEEKLILTAPSVPTDLAFTGAPSSPVNYELFGFGLTCTNTSDFFTIGATKYYVDIALDEEFTQFAGSFKDNTVIYQNFLIEGGGNANPTLHSLFLEMGTGTTYYARVKVGSENSPGVSHNYSNVTTITTPYEFAPKPNGLSLKLVTQNSIEVSWNAIPTFDDNVTLRADLVRIELLEGDTNILIEQKDFTRVEVGVTSYSFLLPEADVQPNTSYKVRLWYQNPSGFGAPTELSGIQTLPVVSPPIAQTEINTKLINSGNDIEFEIRWQEPKAFYGNELTSDPTTEQFEFLLFISDDYFATIPTPIVISVVPETVVGTARNFSQKVTLPANVPVYEYRIKARRKDVGGYTTEYSNTIRVNVPLPAPVALEETVITNTSFVANWKQYPIIAAIQLYLYEVGVDFLTGFNPKIGLNNTNDSLHVENLKPGTLYAYYLRAQFGPQTSEVSNLIYARTTGDTLKPPGPIALPATDITETSFQANWQEYLGEEAYKLVVEKVGDQLVRIEHTIAQNETSKAINNLEAGTRYVYHLIAFLPDSISERSNQIKVLTSGTLNLLPKVTNLLAYSIGSTYFSLTWAYYPGSSGFFVFVREKETGKEISGYENGKFLPVTEGPIKVVGLKEGTVYEVYMTAVYDDIQTPVSSSIEVTTVGATNIITPLNVNSLLYYPVINSLPVSVIQRPPLLPSTCIGTNQIQNNLSKLFLNRVVGGINPSKDYFQILSQVEQDTLTFQFQSLSEATTIRVLEYKTLTILSEETLLPFYSDGRKPNLFQYTLKSWEMPLGKYHIEISAANFNVRNDRNLETTLPFRISLLSEPIQIQRRALNTMLIKYQNNENTRNQSGIDYSTGIIHCLRIPGSLDEAASKVVATSVNNTNNIPEIITGQNTAQVRLVVKHVPAYVHEVIRRALLSDHVCIEGVEFRRSASYTYTPPGQKFFSSGSANLIVADPTKSFINNP